MSVSADNHRWMAQALRLAERGAYTTRPNPMVGCVIVRDGACVGEGFISVPAARMQKCSRCVRRANRRGVQRRM